MKIIIAGSRTINDYELVKQTINESGWVNEMTEVVCGMANGVDLLGKRFADENNIPVEKFPVTKKDWAMYGKYAGRRRNKQMAEYADKLIAIHLDTSPGTLHMINTMRDFEKPVFIKKL